ncbi:hypothetical protein RIF29_25989 [Crotalaria pallida]|uniref:Guanylate kinase/L-type calcium channel beta subunit domain-containing protein n=1 Tax=Crotalaria pallida TaxID=3830 RepID=A0AAN9I046_CROPI
MTVLMQRGTETEEQIMKRLRNAAAEIEQGKSSKIFDFILYNDNLEDCYEKLKKLLGLDDFVSAVSKSGAMLIFLPQDRVSEFAKLTPVQLLKETEKAVGDPQLPEQHAGLVHKI